MRTKPTVCSSAALTIDEDSVVPEDEKTMNFLKTWIKEAEPKKLSRFLEAVTGSPTLISGKNSKLT